MALLPNAYNPLLAQSNFMGVLPNALSEYGLAAQPVAAPATQPAGFQFVTDRGRQAGYGSNPSGFIAIDPNAQYRMWDERGKNKIVASGTGEAALKQIYDLANQYNKEQGKKANYGIERLNPATGKWERVAENDPAKNVVGKIADIALPVAGAFLLPGVGGVLGGALGAGLGAAGGSALSSIAQGRSLEDTLMRAGLSGVAAGGLSAIGGAPFLGATEAPTQAVTQTAAETALQAGTQATAGGASQAVAPVVIDAAGNLFLTGTREAASGLASGLLSGAAGAGVGSAFGSLVGGGTAQPSGEPSPYRDPVTGDLVLTGTRPALPAGIDIGSLAPALPNLIPSSVPTPDLTPEIVVPGERPSPPAPIPVGVGIGSIAPALPNLIPESVPTPDLGGNSLLDDIIKYYSLGSAGLDLLGGALGGGGGGAMTPYVSQLGPMPSFGRGAFTPFGGDYETYGFGPEFNFFGGAPTPTPTAPVMSILPPAALPNTGTA